MSLLVFVLFVSHDDNEHSTLTNSPINLAYTSVAEQNSTELAWEMLMEPAYKDLQKCIYTNEEEQKRFRQMVVNIVLATDIFDKDMTAIRNRRWDKAFHRDDKAIQLTQEEDANLKATIVIEYLMQASGKHNNGGFLLVMKG